MFKLFLLSCFFIFNTHLDILAAAPVLAAGRVDSFLVWPFVLVGAGVPGFQAGAIIYPNGAVLKKASSAEVQSAKGRPAGDGDGDSYLNPEQAAAICRAICPHSLSFQKTLVVWDKRGILSSLDLKTILRDLQYPSSAPAGGF